MATGPRCLSGGQSLMPAMNLRLIAPELIVDIGELAELRGIAVTDDVLSIGALTRHVDLLRSPEIAAHAPLLTEAIAHVAHPAIRNRGTLGGSLAHADPASELPACMLALDATIIVSGPAGERRIAARDFFTGIYETALSAQELLVAVELPVARKQLRAFLQRIRAAARRLRHRRPRGAGDRGRGTSSPICGWRSLPSATGRYWPGPRRDWSASPSRRRCCRKHPRRWARNSIRRRTSRRRLRCAGIWQRCCWRDACPRCSAGPISMPEDRLDGACSDHA